MAKTKIKTKIKTKTLSKLKAELDKVFSEFIRLRDSTDGRGNCITCGKSVFYKEADCGHFMSRRYNSTRWDEQNCHLQCKGCNIFNQGEQFRHGLKIDEKYGKGTAQQLEQKARQSVKYDRVKINNMIFYYKQKVKELKTNNN